jgi:hypothetical protein
MSFYQIDIGMPFLRKCRHGTESDHHTVEALAAGRDGESQPDFGPSDEQFVQ